MTERTRGFFLDQLTQNPRFSVLIVGGGINGAGLFRDLSLQQVDCLLIDKADFASGASSASSRLIHGGLKYLETGEFRLVAESTLERNLLLKNAPHLVQPLETVLPIHSYFGGIVASTLRFFGVRTRLTDRGAIISKLGLSIYDFLGRRHRAMPRHHIALRRRSLRDLPLLNPAIKATATYFDARVTQAERLNYELIADGLAVCEKAAAANYVTIDHVEGDTVWLKDLVSERLFPCAPTVIVNAGGAWVDSVNQSLGIERKYIGGTKGSHLIVDHPVLQAQLRGRMVYFGSKDGRICLIYPFLDQLLVGSTDIRVDDPDRVRCESDEVEYMLAVLQEIFPGVKLDVSNIRFRYSGVRPLPYSDAADPGSISRDHAVHTDHLPGTSTPVLSLVGGKWTTFRGFAESVTDDTLKHLRRSRLVSTRGEAIGGGRGFPLSATDRVAWVAELAARSGIATRRAETLLSRYGTRATAVALFCSLPHDGIVDRPLESEPSYTALEVRYFCECEMVTHLADLIFRRTTIALSGLLSGPLLDEIAEIAARALEWDSRRMDQEIESIRDAAQRHGIVLRDVGHAHHFDT